MEKVIDYVREKNKRLVSMIWPGKKEFNFLCMRHIDFSEALGLEIYQATPNVKLVRQGSIPDEETLNRIIRNGEFDYSFFEIELAKLKNMQQSYDTPCGGGCFGPLTVASGILGIERMLVDTIKRPEFVNKFVQYITNYMMELVQKETAAREALFQWSRDMRPSWQKWMRQVHDA